MLISSYSVFYFNLIPLRGDKMRERKALKENKEQEKLSKKRMDSSLFFSSYLG